MLWTEMRKADVPFSADLMLGLAPVIGRVAVVASARVTHGAHLAPKTPGPAKRRPKRASELLIAAR